MSFTRIGLAIVMIAAAITSVYALFRAIDDRSAPPIIIEDASAILPVAVDLRGAVAQPGLYELPPGARVQDAIAAAGGLAPDADLSTINLARRVRDGEVVAIARLPSVAGSPNPALPPADGDVVATEESPRININTATAAELDALPGIGEVTAARIIAYRDEHGPYRSVDDLIHVQGISARTIEGFRDQVTTSP